MGITLPFNSHKLDNKITFFVMFKILKIRIHGKGFTKLKIILFYFEKRQLCISENLIFKITRLLFAKRLFQKERTNATTFKLISV